MNQTIQNRLTRACLAGVVCLTIASPSLGQVLAPPRVADLQSEVLRWVAERSAGDQAVLQRTAEMWAAVDQSTPAADLLEATVGTISLVDPQARKLLAACAPDGPPRDFAPLSGMVRPGEPPRGATNGPGHVLWPLARRRMFDEALEVYDPLDLSLAIDPAGFLFFKAVCEHSLLQKEPGLKTLDQLLNKTQDPPVRYVTVARLMEADLKQLEDSTLDEVARKMSDVERRLDLGRGGPTVQKVEDEIIATLDEIIKRLEAQSGGGGGGGGSSGGNSNSPSGPAQDSTIKGAKAPGEVDPKKVSSKGDWGALPPKDEARAKNLITRNFPSTYKQAVEEYFKKIADRQASSGR